MRPANVVHIILLCAQAFGELGNAPVVVGILECFTHALVFIVGLQQSMVHQGGQAQVIPGGAFLHGFQGQFGIELFQSLHVRIHDHGYTMVADHTIGFAAAEFPYRQSSTFFVLHQEGLDVIDGSLLVDDGVEGMSAAIGIPE